MTSGYLIEELKRSGVRVTPQRAIILEAIEQMPGHITAEDVFTAVHQVNRYVNLATVYRTLDLLRELDLIIETDMGASAIQFALQTHGSHHHAVCRRCGRSFEFPDALLAPVIDELATHYHFTADARHVVIFGWCASCSETEQCSDPRFLERKTGIVTE
jgi:Fur family ferric uptake transcriptional regulator